MRQFDSPAAFATFLRQTVAQMEEGRRDALDAGADILLERVREIPGHYQKDWAPLQAKTIARKANGDTPLLETGELRDSYAKHVTHEGAEVGSNLDIAVFQELGTSRGIPPRPVLLTAAVEKGKVVAHKVAEKYVRPLVKG